MLTFSEKNYKSVLCLIAVVPKLSFCFQLFSPKHQLLARLSSVCQTVKHSPVPATLTNEINLILKLQQVRPLFCGTAPAVTLAGGPALSQESAAGTRLWCASWSVPYKDSGGKEQATATCLQSADKKHI